MSRNCSGENRMGFRVIAISLAAAMSATAFAAPSCPAAPVLPSELADWARDASSKTIYAYGDDLGADWSPLGAARTELLLHRFESLRYGVAPERKPDVHKFGGTIPLAVQTAWRSEERRVGKEWVSTCRYGR